MQVTAEKILFLDIETVPRWANYDDMTDDFRRLWDHKTNYIKLSPEDTPRSLFPKAGIYAEFGKIICISTGFFHQNMFRIKSFYGDDEKILLEDFKIMIERMYSSQPYQLAAHNGKEFDFPYISRRMLVNEISLPDIFDNSGKKPWETSFIDTMEMWKFGDYKHYTSLALLSALFNIPSPKGDIDGSQVASVYYIDNDLKRIVRYCQNDVLTLARVFCKIKGLPSPTDDQVIIID